MATEAPGAEAQSQINTTTARMYLRFSCGCGFVSENAEDAEKHAAEENHVLDVRGSVVPTKRRV